MQYTGLLFYPRGASLRLDVGDLSPIQDQTAFELYSQFKQGMDADEFDATAEAGEGFEPILLKFRRAGQTAAYAAFARGELGTAVRLEAAMALLTRLDAEDDAAVMAKLLSNPNLQVIDLADFEAASLADGPTAAAFFASDEALNDPVIHGLMSLAGAAFFDRLGLLDEG